MGRIADVLNVLGEKIAVEPIEERIRQSLEVDGVCVFSGVNVAGQNELVIAIESDSEPAKEKLDSISGEFVEFDKVRFSVLRGISPRGSRDKKVRRAALRKQLFPEPGKGLRRAHQSLLVNQMSGAPCTPAACIASFSLGLAAKAFAASIVENS